MKTFLFYFYSILVLYWITKIQQWRLLCCSIPSQYGPPSQPGGCSLEFLGWFGSCGYRALWWSPSAPQLGWSPGRRYTPLRFVWPPGYEPSPLLAVREVGEWNISLAEIHPGEFLFTWGAVSNNNSWGSGTSCNTRHVHCIYDYMISTQLDKYIFSPNPNYLPAGVSEGWTSRNRRGNVNRREKQDTLFANYLDFTK